MINIGVVDYGAGNIASVMKAIDYAGADPKLVGTPEDILSCDKLVLPGVGATARAMNNLKDKGLDAALDEAVGDKAIPLLGICVGMQIMATDLHEYGPHKGLGWIKGSVISLTDKGITDRPVPHMGWSDTEFRGNLSDLPQRLGRHKIFYYCHSYTLVAEDDSVITSTASYGGVELVAGVKRDNIIGFQFHPEKSQVAGDYLMQWFMDWEP